MLPRSVFLLGTTRLLTARLGATSFGTTRALRLPLRFRERKPLRDLWRTIEEPLQHHGAGVFPRPVMVSNVSGWSQRPGNYDIFLLIGLIIVHRGEIGECRHG